MATITQTTTTTTTSAKRLLASGGGGSTSATAGSQVYGKKREKIINGYSVDYKQHKNDDQLDRAQVTVTASSGQRASKAAAVAANKNIDDSTTTTTTITSVTELAATTTTGGDKREPAGEFKAQLVWSNIFLFIILHSSLPVAIYMLITEQPWKTFLWTIALGYAGGMGVTAGTHRLWSHRAYKARAPVEILLMLLQTLAGQNSIYTWSRDHRVHHKYAETDADPHNINRGFFFAHMGWLLCRKHPEVKAKGALIDMRDLKANKVVMFQHRNFWWLASLCAVVIPTVVPMYAWGERFWTSFMLSFFLRYLLTLHGTWLVNSAAHYFGNRPYDQHQEARESPFVINIGLGEGFHNYHHTFPYDYSTGEFGRYFNLTTTFIDLCALLGLVSDRRTASTELVRKRQERTGDATAKVYSESGGRLSFWKHDTHTEGPLAGR